MICKLYANDMSDVITRKLFYLFLWVSSKGLMFSKFKKESMHLLSFMSSFKCCKNFPLKINFSESTFLEVYAVVHYMNLLSQSLSLYTFHGLLIVNVYSAKCSVLTYKPIW